MASEHNRRSFLQFLNPNPDQVIVGKVPESERTTTETGVDRLKRMFQLDEYGSQSKEVIMITQTFCLAALGGGVAGAFVQSRIALQNFLENNQATKFNNHMHAKRELQRTMSIAFGQGAWRWGWRIGIFTMTFTTLMTSISVYRGKESMVEYVVAGGATGALYKMNLGLKGAFAGFVAGSGLGGIAGAASLLMLKLAGMSMDDISGYSKEFKDARDARIRATNKEATLKEYEFQIKEDADDTLFKNLKVDEDEDEEPK